MTVEESTRSPEYYLQVIQEIVKKALARNQDLTMVPEEFFNAFADYWRYYVGVNVIPIIGTAKVPPFGCKWGEYQHVPISEEQHNAWKRDNAFRQGVGVIAGKVWHRKDLEGYYFAGVDADNPSAITELLTISGRTLTVEQLAQRTIVSQHTNKSRLQFYVYTVGAQLRDKASDMGKPGMDADKIPAFEVKASSNLLLYVPHSPHKKYGLRMIVGTWTPMTMYRDAVIEYQNHLDSICKKYGLDIGVGNGNGKSKYKIPMRKLFKDDFVIYEGHNRHLQLMLVMEYLIKHTSSVLPSSLIIKICHEWNEMHCKPPLDEKEFDKQWKSATEFVFFGRRSNGDGNSNEQRKIMPEDISFAIDTMKKEAPHDEIAIKQIFYGLCSAFTKNPIHHNINSKKSGSGKNYTLGLVSRNFPMKYIIELAGVSDKGFMHEDGIQVIVDEDTGETIPAEPIINEIKASIKAYEKELRKLKESRRAYNKSSVVKVSKQKSETDPIPIQSPQEAESKAEEMDKAEEELEDKIDAYNEQIDDINARSQKLIDLTYRIILVLDTPPEGLFSALMSVISQDTGTRDQIYQFTDKKGSGKLGATKNRLRGAPCMITTQVIDDTRQTRYQEKNRRFVHVTPNVSSKKIDTALSLIGSKYGSLPGEYDKLVVSKEDKEHVKETIAVLVDKLIEGSNRLAPGESGIEILYRDAISYSLSSMVVNSTEWAMTVMDRLMRYLIVITRVNADARPKIIDTETEISYPISTFEDLKETLQLGNAAFSELRPYIAIWYNNVFLPTYKNRQRGESVKTESDKTVMSDQDGLTTRQLAEATKSIMKLSSIPSNHDILYHYLYPLLNQGAVNSERRIMNLSENLWSPAEEGNIFSVFSGEDIRLKIVDKAFYPSKNVMVKTTCGIVDDDSKEGGILEKNIFVDDTVSNPELDQRHAYKIVDPDGNEISLEILIDRYLNNPETCFKDGRIEVAARAISLTEGVTPVRGHEDFKKHFFSKYHASCCRHQRFHKSIDIEESSKNRPYDCPHCQIRFESLENYRIHIDEKHGGMF